MILPHHEHPPPDIRHNRLHRLILIVLVAMFYSAVHTLTRAMPRYQLVVDAVLAAFAALGLLDLAQRTRFGRRLLPSSP